MLIQIEDGIKLLFFSKIHISGTVYPRLLSKAFLKSGFLVLSKISTENGNV